MRIAVLGGTGRTGLLLIRELLRRDHEISVLVRDATKMSDLAQQVEVHTGDSRNRADLDRLVADADAVVSTLGPTAKEGSLHTDTARALVAAMEAAGVGRFVGVSGAGIDVPGDEKSLSAKVISKIIQTVGGEVVKDKPAEYAVYAATDLDWTLVRPPRLVEGEPPDVSNTTPTARRNPPKSPAPTSPPSSPTRSSKTATRARHLSWPPREAHRNSSPANSCASVPLGSGLARVAFARAPA